MLAQITDALRRGDAAAALSTARSFAAAEPENAAARHLLGVCLQRTGDPVAAKAEFERAIELAPDRAEAHFSLAALRLGQGDAPGAIRGLHETVSLDPNQLGAYVMLAHLALGRGDLPEAKRQLKLAQRVNAEHAQVMVLEGHILQAEGDADGALKVFNAAASRAPKLPAAQLALGTAYLGRKMWAFAEQALNNALALDPSRAPSTLRALIEARRRQRKRDETLEALGELIALVPDDLYARALRADILMETDPLAALPDLEAVLKHRPAHAPTLLSATTLMARNGRADDALALCEAAIAAKPDDDAVWRARLNLTGLLGEDAKALLDRWQDARPDSPAVLDLLAGYHRTRGEMPLAIAYADRALAQSPDMAISTSVKLREELGTDPELALARADRLLAETKDPAARRTLLVWAGLALDALGRHGEAAQRWRAMIATPSPSGLFVVPPSVARAAAAPAGEGAGTLLLAPPGVRSEYLLQTMTAMLGPKLRLDRLRQLQTEDGFGVVHAPPGHPAAGNAQRWREAIAKTGLAPEEVVDFLPFFDGYTLQALQGARVVAMVTDPRDALLNWLVHGSLQNFLFSNVAENSAGWLATVLAMLVDHGNRHPGQVHVVRLDVEPGAAAAQLESLLGLPQPLPAVFGDGPRFAPGHWRRYREAFAKEFAMLAPVAQALGYPAD